MTRATHLASTVSTPAWLDSDLAELDTVSPLLVGACAAAVVPVASAATLATVACLGAAPALLGVLVCAPALLACVPQRAPAWGRV